MLRILQYVGGMNKGGIETLLINLHRNIDRERVQFDYLILSEDKQDYEEEIYRLGGKLIRTHIKGKHGLHYFKFRKFLDELFTQNPEYKIIHSHEAVYTAIVNREAHRCGLIAIAHSHATKSTAKDLRTLEQKLFMYPARYTADYFFACSRQAGIDRYGKKVSARFFPNGINTESYRFSEDVRIAVRNKHVEGGGY